MTKQTDWLESFTGLAVADGGALPGGGADAAAAAYEQKRRRQQVMLAGVRQELQAFKKGFQDAMAQKVTEGNNKGQRLLKEDGTQLDEIEVSEFSVADLAGTPEAKALIAEGGKLVNDLSLRLSDATFTVAGQAEPLFTKEELIAEYWTPLTRERLLPEGYIPAQFSQTQRMLDESTQYFLEEVETRKAEGRLTPKMDRGRMLIDSAADLVDVGGALMSGFAPGTEAFKQAAEAMKLASAVLRQGATAYDSVKARKFADAASTALEAMGSVAAGAIGIGRDSDESKLLSKAVGSAFSAGSVAIKAGAAFSEGIEGAEEGLTLMGGVVQKSLMAAVALTTDPAAKEALRIAAATAPAAFTQAALALNLRQKIYDEDYAGIVQCLSKSVTTVMVAVQQSRAAVEMKGLGKDQAARVEQKYKDEAERIQGLTEVGSTGVEMTIKMAIAAKRGDYVAGLNGLIDDIGSQLSTVLQAAGVDKAQAEMIGQFYVAASSAPKALQCLTAKECDVPGALNQLSAGILIAFKQADPDGGLRPAGFGLSLALQGAGSALRSRGLYAEGKYGEAVEAFTGGVKGQIAGVFDLTGLADEPEEVETTVEQAWGSELSAEDDDEEEEEATLAERTDALVDTLNEQSKAIAEGKESAPDPKAVMAELRRAAQMAKKGGKVAAHLEEARLRLENEQKAAAQKAAQEDADETLAEANADLQALSEAQKSGGEASNIDKLIAKIEFDRMIYNLAMQITQGGAGFLAKFVPALGAVAAGIKLAAQLHAAGLRAQQVYRWYLTQDGLEAAQSALSSSAGNFLRNQAEQLAHHAAQALFAAASLAGEITKLSGVAAPVGLGLQAAAEAGAKLEEIVRKHARAENLESAWKVTASALRNPGNRKLGLEARKQNPSLAKYSIAWGAVIAKDPLARDAMRNCDLTEASFADEGTDVHKVVRYLETFYNDDPQLYRELEATPDWVPKDLGLELAAWTRLKRMSVAEGRLISLETGKIDGLLARVDSLPDDPPWVAVDKAMKNVMEALVEAKKKRVPGTMTPMPDTTAVRSALAAVEVDLKARIRLYEQLGVALKGFEPKANPEATEKTRTESVKAMGVAVRSLAKQSASSVTANTTEMQRVTEQLLFLT